MEQAMIQHRKLNYIHSIAGTDYSSYQNPLKELLEYRKLACIKYIEGNDNEKELLIIMDYCNEKIKLYLGIW